VRTEGRRAPAPSTCSPKRATRQGNIARTGTSYWVAGGGDLWFTAGNQDRIDVIPEKRSYAPGEIARFQVRTPFREATALVSVEAGGIIETFVQPLSRFKPVIEMPVKGEWGPNVFVSVLAVRGRVEPLKWYSLFQWGWREPLAGSRNGGTRSSRRPWSTWPNRPTASGWRNRRRHRWLQAEGRGQQRQERLPAARRGDGQDQGDHARRQAAPAGTEVAFAAVDQALLELRPNESWNLLDAMLPKRGYEVETRPRNRRSSASATSARRPCRPAAAVAARRRANCSTRYCVEPARRPRRQRQRDAQACRSTIR
jgi:hypothetical protein